MRRKSRTHLPAIPAKRYFVIGEAAALCGVKPHVLIYWEQHFSQLRPVKRGGKRRHYQHSELLLIRRIRELLYEERLTIRGARDHLARASYDDQTLSDLARARIAGELRAIVKHLRR